MSPARRIVGSVGAVAVGCAALLAITAGPAYAGCDSDPPLPDGKIRRVGGQYKGQGLIECLLVPGNTVTLERQPGESARFEVRFKNQKATSQDILLRDFSGPDSDFKVTVLRGTKDITEKITSAEGGKTFPDIAPGASTPVITVRVKVRASATSGDDRPVTMIGNYGAAEVNGDAVYPMVEVP